VYSFAVKIVILAGGLGTRLREETEFKPKPMVEIGDQPILWHILKNFSAWGLEDFVIALGYKGEVIKNYFLNYQTKLSDLEVNLEQNSEIKFFNSSITEKWRVTLADTGLLTMTGGRLLKLRKYLGNEPFICTYGDGLSNININKLIEFHKSHGKIATVTAARPVSRFGVLNLDERGLVRDFAEKGLENNYVSAGFFVFNPEIFELLDNDSILENEPLRLLVKNSELMAFKHEAFWKPMDTLRDMEEINEIWANGFAPWKNWSDDK
jgi:glucose-1-phosphate cytidylyltransferase